MDVDYYAQHITHKYRLAIAISVLKEKPDDVTIEEYIERLKNSIEKEKENIRNVDDLDITVCSDDFNMDDTSIEVNDFAHKSHNNVNIINDYMKNDTKQGSNDKQINNHSTNTPKALNNEKAQGTSTQESVNLLKDYIINDITNDNDKLANDTQDSTDLLKDYNVNDVLHFNDQRNNDGGELKVQAICSTSDINCNNKIFVDIANVNGLKDRNCNTVQTNNYTASETQYGVNNIFSQDQQQTTAPNAIINQSFAQDEMATYCDSQIKNSTFYNDGKEGLINRNATNLDSDNYSQLTMTNFHDLTENYTHYSESQINNFVISRNLITNAIDKGNPKPINYKDNVENMEVDTNVRAENESIALGSDLGDLESQNKNINVVCVEIIENADVNEDLVPFKVIEELNKVKTYLNRREERERSAGSLDSGYKSDSQSRISRRSQQPGNKINQSAYSLFKYLMNSPMIATTHEIFNKISQVLAELVDRLHEEEKYLSFLDELLEVIDKLLQDICEDDSTGENILLNKDEMIQRLLLLNHSVHIEQYTINKVINILESIYEKITNPEQTFEIENINVSENLVYIFHILEILLQKYLKNKQVTKKNVPKPGELKMSSIVNLWRKKWYPHLEENVGSQEISRKKCVIQKCNEVLNKIVVNCMDGYSLISYSALQCFNLLQS